MGSATRVGGTRTRSGGDAGANSSNLVHAWPRRRLLSLNSLRSEISVLHVPCSRDTIRQKDARDAMRCSMAWARDGHTPGSAETDWNMPCRETINFGESWKGATREPEHELRD